MSRTKRDYRAEYRRRIARGRSRGMSRAQARGHPRAGESHVSPRRAPPTYDRRLEHGLKLLKDGRSLSGAARDLGVSPERLRHYLGQTGIVAKTGQRWIVRDDRRSREMLLFSDGQARKVLVGPEGASAVGRYMSAVGRFLESNDPVHLKPFVGGSIADVHGAIHPFETRPNALYRLDASGGETFEQVYRIVA